MPVSESIKRLVDTVVSQDEAVLARCALALSLASKLDEAVSDSTATSAMAVPALSKELRAAIEEIQSAEGEREEFVASIFN